MHRRLAGAIVALLTMGGLALVNLPARADDTVAEVGGGAWGVEVVVNGPAAATGINPTPNVTLPADGSPGIYGEGHAIDDWPYLRLATATAYTRGQRTGPEYAFSEARTQDVYIDPDPYNPRMRRTHNFAAIKTHCEWSTDGAFGSTALTARDGTVTEPAPDTMVPIPGLGTMVLNEQVYSSVGGRQVLSVNGVHLHLARGATSIDVYLAVSSCDPLRVPVFATPDARFTLCQTTCVVDPYNNAAVTGDCASDADNNGDGMVDSQDYRCYYSYCAEDGIDHLGATPAEGAVSGMVHDQVEPPSGHAGLGVQQTVHNASCAIAGVEAEVDYQLWNAGL